MQPGGDSIEARRGVATATLWRSLTQSPMQVALWLQLVFDYASCGLSWQAGYTARQALRLDAGAAAELEALGIGKWWDASQGDGLLGRECLPDADRLRERFAARVEERPDDWLTWLYLARLGEMYDASGAKDLSERAALRLHSPEVALQRARDLEPISGESLHWMGVWRLNAGDATGAITALRELADVHPARHGSMMYLGEALLRAGQVAAAEKAFARASESSNADFLVTLASRVFAQNYWHEAIAVLKKALTLKSDSVPILLALAKIQSEVYLLGDCRETLRQAQALEPANREARLLAAGLQGRMGDARGHLATLQEAYESGGDPLSRLASSIAMTSLYNDTLSPEEITGLHRRLCAPIEAAVARKGEFPNERSSTRRLRIGYVTGDLHRQHPVNIFMLPVLLRHDPARFEVHVYHTGMMHDDYTRQAKASVSRWVEASGMDDPTLHRMILEDRIDVLIDLAGHTSSHRLGVFAMRAAPVQATFLGYPHSTGLSTIDWLIGDATVSPVEHGHLFSEGIAQLPASVFCWAPVDEYPLPPPRQMDARVVFASFNNAMKLAPKTVSLWAQVLRAVPEAVLLLKAPSLRDEAVQASLAQRFAAQGIERERLRFRGPSGLADMMQEYGEVDIALDPLPYNGGTTTLQALWMGVPVVTLEGGNFAGRMGASFMKALGRPEWVAQDVAQYVNVAARLARDLHAVREGRAQLRAQMMDSPLCDIEAYVKHFEALLERMWHANRNQETQRVIGTVAQEKANSTMQDPSIARTPTATTPAVPALEITTSRQMLAWLAEQRLSLAFTTYQIGKLFLLGLKESGELSVFERTFNRCMGLAATPNGFYLSSLHQVWRFENVFRNGETQDGYDRLYVPQVGNTTGDLDIHDMAVDAEGRLVFVNTLFGCLATLSETHSFRPLWRPRFISKLAAEDRCHLNGLAMKDGRPAYVTAVSQSDVVDGWREHRADGGIVIDVAGNEIVASGLSMPHSPRWHQGKLWLLNSGTGEFGYIEPTTGRFAPVTFCTGYLRGLYFHGDYALVGLSKPRYNKTFSGLPLDERLRSHNAEARCGIQVIDLHTGDAVHWLRIEGVVEELYDVVTLPGVRRPMALGFVTDEIRRVISIDE